VDDEGVLRAVLSEFWKDLSGALWEMAQSAIMTLAKKNGKV
jgi:hypothetical protein